MDGLGFNTFEQQDRVLVGLNGGADSAVTVRVLQEQGFAVQAALVRDAAQDETAVTAAQAAADALGVSLCVIEAQGMLLDAALKFQLLAQAADKLGCQFIATGHYARVALENGTCRLQAPERPEDDQTDRLRELPQEVLSRLILPLGEFGKADAREIARDLEIPGLEM